MLTTDQKGAVAELAIAVTAAKLGVGVYRAVNDGERYDLILDVEGRLLRTQCKWASRCGDGVVIRCYSTRRARRGLVKRAYTSEEVDAIAAYCAELDRCFLIPMRLLDGHPEVRLRLRPTRNNQRRGIRWADEFDFAARLVASKGP